MVTDFTVKSNNFHFIFRNSCAKCHPGCIDWDGPFIEDCRVCNFPRPFLLNHTWVSEWDTQLYDYDYQEYKWVQNNFYDAAVISSNPECQTDSLLTKDNLMVSITIQGFSSSNYDYGWLEMNIINKRGNITLTKFTQIEPVPTPSDPLTNIFPLIPGTTTQYVNETQFVELNQLTLNNYPLGTTFTITAEITNDWGDKAIAYIDLVRETPPVIGDISITWPKTPCRILENFYVELTGTWHNKDPLKMELYIKIIFELPDGKTIYGHVSQWEQDKFNLTLPILSTSSNANLNINILVVATNIYDISTTLNKTIVINNTIGDFEKGEIYNELDKSHIILSPPLKSPLIFDFCVYNSDCSNQGEWVSTRIGKSWVCNLGYSGIDWSIQSHEYSILQVKMNEVLGSLTTKIVVKGFSSRVNFEDNFIIFWDYIGNPELVDSSIMNTIEAILKSASKMSTPLLYSMSEQFTSVFLNTISNFMLRIRHEFNINLKKEYLDSIYSELITTEDYTQRIESLKKQEEIICKNFKF